MLGVGVRVLADNPLKPLGGGGRIVHEYIIAHLGRCSFSNSLLPEGESLACSSNNVFSLEEIPFSYAENFCCLIWTPSAYPEYFLLLSGAMAPHFFYCCFPKTILVWPDPPPYSFDWPILVPIKTEVISFPVTRIYRSQKHFTPHHHFYSDSWNFCFSRKWKYYVVVRFHIRKLP